MVRAPDGGSRYSAKQTAGQCDGKADAAYLESGANQHCAFNDYRYFFQWLIWQPGYRSRFQHSDAEYFNLSDKDTQIATAQREQRVPTLEQIKHVIQTMPTKTEIERRNRALIAFTLLTGARNSAIASIKLKHVDLIAGMRPSRRAGRKDKIEQDLQHVLLSRRRRSLRIVEA